MDQLSSGTFASNPQSHPSSSCTATTTSTTSSVIVQQQSNSSGAIHLSSSLNNNSNNNSAGDLDNSSLGGITASSASHQHTTSTSTSSAGHGSSQLELTPVQQQRIISTTQQHLLTPTGPGGLGGQSPIVSPPGKVYGRNYNGTMVVTSTPTNEAELQLYRVLQRASLLMYYDTLLEMGGDDVQQLCDAGEEEFLEIMALVGMASKPLHVRRLQKALQEWVTNPSLFQAPLPSNDSTPSRVLYSPEPSASSRSPFSSNHAISSPYSSGAVGPSSGSLMASSTTSITSLSSLASNLGSHHLNNNSNSGSSLQLTPTLTDSQIARLVMSAERLSRQLPQLEPRPQNSKKRSSKDLEQVMAMSDSDPRRMDEIRKYAAIYGRFDCKRRPEKPLTLHEVCVNEAAAQICKLVPVLLTRRDELFPLARQVVRDSGFGHSAGIARFAMSSSGQVVTRNDDHEGNIMHGSGNGSIAKRTRLATGHMDNQSTPGSGSMHGDGGKDMMDQRDKILSLYQRMGKNFDFAETTKFSFNNALGGSYGRQEYDDNDSRYSFSSSSSPPLQTTMGCSDISLNLSSSAEINNHNNSSDMHCDKLDDSKDLLPLSPDSHSEHTLGGVQIISASGGHIIAVANPALALSPALAEAAAGVLNVKREVVSPDLL